MSSPSTDGVVHAIAEPAKRVTYAELVGGRYLDSTVKWNGRAEQRARRSRSRRR